MIWDFISQHLYLVSGLYLLTIWVVLFKYLREHDQSRPMFILSIWFAILTPIVAQICLSDWWSPNYIVKVGFVGVEDLLFGFSGTGVSVGIYTVLKQQIVTPFHKHVSISNLYRIMVVLVSIGSIFVLFYGFGFSSYISTSVSMVIMMVAMLLKSYKPIPVTIATGVALLAIMLPGYFIASMIQPGWIQEYWLLSGFPSQLLFGIPIAEYTYYLLSGMSTASLTEILFGSQLK